jgi:hypothetical protein
MCAAAVVVPAPSWSCPPKVHKNLNYRNQRDFFYYFQYYYYYYHYYYYYYYYYYYCSYYCSYYYY